MQLMYSLSLEPSCASLSSSDETAVPLSATALAAAFKASAAFLASAICLQPPSENSDTTPRAAAKKRLFMVVGPPKAERATNVRRHPARNFPTLRLSRRSAAGQRTQREHGQGRHQDAECERCQKRPSTLEIRHAD